MDDATSALQRGVVQRGVGIPAAEYCPALTSLYVYGCDKLTDDHGHRGLRPLPRLL